MAESKIFEEPIRRNPIRYKDAEILATSNTLEPLLDEYRTYRDDEFRIILRREDNNTFEDKTIAVLGSKRGNSVYTHKIRKRLAPIRNYPDHQFFNFRDRSRRHKTKALFVDYTYNREGSLSDAWKQIGKDLNRQFSLIRSRYGAFSDFRTFEAQRDGYPHIHAVLIFKDYEFETFHYNGKWRIQERDDLIWSEGFSDILALSSTRSGLRYVSKYMTKGYGSDSPMGELTHALMWAFHKRSYAVSGDFLDLIKSMSNSNTDELIQTNLSGETLPIRIKWRLIGFYHGSLGVDWFIELTLSEIRDIRNSGSWFEPKPKGGDYAYH